LKSRRERVVDASVIVKLFVIEELSEEARRFFKSGSLLPYVPDFLYIECANIFWKYVRRFHLSLPAARDNLFKLRKLRLQPVSVPPSLQSVIHLASRYEISAYDAAYAALAHDLSIPLVTADRKLVGKLADSEVDVRWLGELNP
jgi:predicted nucleic acid-binding protein